MKDIFDATIDSPLTILKAQAIEAQAEKVKMQQENEKTISDIYSQMAQLVKQFWTLRQVLSTVPMEAHEKQAVNIYIKNFYNGLTRMGIDIVEANKALYTEETGKFFEIITSLPSPEVEALTVNRTLSPAIFLNEQLLIKGGIQILEPGEDSKEQSENKDNNK